MNTDSFVNALRWFVSRRGSRKKIIRDNGTNFKGSERDLKEVLADLEPEKIARHLGHKDIQWEFNPPMASHMGGVWECIIRSIRHLGEALIKIVSQSGTPLFSHRYVELKIAFMQKGEWVKK